MDYLDRWYEEYRVGKTGDVTFSAKELLLLISPYKKGLRLSSMKLGLDLKKKPFIIKDRTRNGNVYTVAF